MSIQNTKWEKIFFRELLNNTVTVPHLLLDYYSEIGLDENQVITILKIMRYVGSANESFFLKDVLPAFSNEREKALGALSLLVSKKIIGREKSSLDDEPVYSLAPLYDNLWEIWAYLQSRSNGKGKQSKKTGEKGPKKKDAFTTVYQSFEQEMARPLSPYEGNKIADWLDHCHYKPEIILEALKRAVLYGKYNFAYIDKILLSWQRQNLQTLKQIEEQEADHQGKGKGANHSSGKSGAAKGKMSKIDSSIDKDDFALLIAKSLKEQKDGENG